MKMVRSLLLGSAAGFVAVAGAQAADMPVKAKPVEYVKICSLYGAGYYYLPGTDICVKHGAYIRSQTYFGVNGNSTNGPMVGPAGQNSRLQGFGQDYQMRARAVYTLDARTQTEYGTLRAYVLIGGTHDSPTVQGQPAANASSLYFTRAFIQFAGFTVGKATSFYDLYAAAAYSILYPAWSSDTGDGGHLVSAYTFQFGNGFSATIAAEDSRRLSVTNLSVTNPIAIAGADVSPWLVGVTPGTDIVQQRWPDLVANIRVDQAWGSIQVMGALHDVSGGFWLPTAGGACFPAFAGTLTQSLLCGHPDDELGFAVGAGFKFNVPMPGGLTDVFSAQFNYAEGATRYVVLGPAGTNAPNFFNGNAGVGTIGSLGLGFWQDAYFANPGFVAGYDGSIQKQTAWGINAAWDHLWTPNLKTSVYGAYMGFEHGATAVAIICASLAANSAAGSFSAPIANCDPDFQMWYIGSRTQWNITPSFYIAADVAYMRLETAFAGGFGFFTAAAGAPRPSGLYTIEDQDTIAGTIRVHWDILP
jgi:porin-like protein